MRFPRFHPPSELSIQQQRAIDLLCLALSTQEVAKAVGVALSVLEGWEKSDPAFVAELRARQRANSERHEDKGAREGDRLRQKISSKMTVSTFLAGFNFTVLSLVLTVLSDDKPLLRESRHIFSFTTTKSSILGSAAALFFVSAALFVAAIYSYDRLLMPASFWSKLNDRKITALKLVRRFVRRLERSFTIGSNVSPQYQLDLDEKNLSSGLRQEFERERHPLSKSAKVKRGHWWIIGCLTKTQGNMWTIKDKSNKEVFIIIRDEGLNSLTIYRNVEERDRIYLYMIWTWLTMFIPATVASTIGALLMFYAIVKPTLWVFTITCTIIVLIYYCFFKPKLGVD
jgi:hypothetical protein